jgi:(R,R)-butanediol dehydrogenase/meso-butanediol dehydrogenase/diacetyl reductase
MSIKSVGDVIVRAAVFHGAGKKLAIEEVADPSPGERQMVLRIESCGICGTDLTMARGHGIVQWPPGYVPGHEYSGEVVAVGGGVERFSVGDRVTAMAIRSCCGRCDRCMTGNEAWCTGDDQVLGGGSGGFAEYALLGDPQAVRLREVLSWDDGALVEPLACGLHAVDLSDLRPGTNIAVIGSGPIALAAIYWARRRGAGRIVVVATSDRRERFARMLGATDFVVGDKPGEAVLEMAGGPPPVVFEAAGVPGTLGLALDLVAPRGLVTVLGYCTEPDSFVPMVPLMKQVRVQFSFVYGSGDYDAVMGALAAEPDGPRVMVTNRISLDQLPERFESLLGRNLECKVLLSPS